MQLKKIGKMMTSVMLCAAVVLTSGIPGIPAIAAKDADSLTGNGKTAKNVIVMISDGMGYNQVAATDYYTYGRSGSQIYEKFPTILGMSTYSLENQGTAADDGSYDPLKAWNDFYYPMQKSTDSAAAGTAMSTGTKTYDAAIGVDDEELDLSHMTEEFEAQGKSTGVISSVEFSHATPASFVAHNASRNNYSDIANEMIRDSATDVIMGAGNPLFDDNGNVKTTGSYKYVGGADTWNQLVNGTLEAADADGDGESDPWTLIQTKAEFEALQTGETPDRLIGVPQVYTTLQQARGGDQKADAYEVDFNDNVPSLDIMAKGALNVLDHNEEGFFLMIEGGAVDWAGHANQSGRLIEEQADFNQAVEAVCDWVEENSSWSETLLIVTGDHETGYLTGTAGVNDSVVNLGTGTMPQMAWNSGDHTNALIPFYAKGKGAELFKKLADEVDPVRGAYLDNTELSAAIRQLTD